MNKWVLLLSITIAGVDEHHAKGPFSSEGNCMRYVEMLHMSGRVGWIGRCVTEREWRTYYPDLPVDVES